MNKEFIPYTEALALKELGFDEKCLANYLYTKKLDISFWRHGMDTPAPLYQQAFRWFREKYGLLNHITTHLNPYGEDDALEESCGYRIMRNNDGWKCSVWEILSQYDTYEEAELECLIKLIEIVKNK